MIPIVPSLEHAIHGFPGPGHASNLLLALLSWARGLVQNRCIHVVSPYRTLKVKLSIGVGHLLLADIGRKKNANKKEKKGGRRDARGSWISSSSMRHDGHDSNQVSLGGVRRKAYVQSCASDEAANATQIMLIRPCYKVSFIHVLLQHRRHRYDIADMIFVHEEKTKNASPFRSRPSRKGTS